MSNLVVVAIPAENDYVHKIASEKVPHLTLLFLGEEETADIQQIMLFVQHATALSEHGPFYLDVDRRGTLGEDKADVIFFSKRSWNLKWIKQFRSQLLQNQAVRSAYDSTEQFPEWTPHLTMGYPATPAKDPEEGHDYPLYSVAFDRIAVWTGNYEGPEFRLEWPERELEGDLAVAYSDAQKAALLHYGVTGMRKGQGTPNRINRKNGRDPKRLAILYGRRRGKKEPFAVQKKIADQVNQKLGPVNSKYKDDDFSNVNWGNQASWNERTKGYHAEVAALTTASDRSALKNVYGVAPKGKRRTELNETGDRLVVREAKVAHAVDDDAVAIFKVTRDARGFITNVEPLEQEEEMSQAMELGEEFVEHFGTKGMKWGVRNVRSGARAIGRATNRVLDSLNEVFYQTSIYSSSTHEAIHNQVADEIDEKVYRLQSAPKYRGKSLKTDKKLSDEYDQDVAKVTDSAYRRAVKDNIGDNPKGTKTARYVDDARGPRIEIRDKKTGKLENESDLRSVQAINADRLDEDLAQAATDVTVPDITIPLKLDSNGQIKAIGRVTPKSSAEHGAIFVDGFMHGSMDDGEAFVMEHYGTKGMRWGVRNTSSVSGAPSASGLRSQPQAVAPTVQSRVPHGGKRKTQVKTQGGENHPASNDAIKVEASRAKLKKSGPKALSNQELQDVANRLRLEQAAVELDRSKPKAFVRNILGNQGKQAANQLVREGINSSVEKTKKKK